MVLVADNKTVVEQITNLTVIDKFIETIFVEEDSGKIEMTKTIKNNNKIYNVSKEINYNLKSSKITIKSCKLIEGKLMISDFSKNNTITKGGSNCDFIHKNINDIFSFEFSNFIDVKNYKFNYKNQNFFKKIFFPTKDTDLLKKIKELSIGKSWIFIPENIKSIIEKDPSFITQESECKKLIYCMGHIDGTSVYVNPEENCSVYFGNYDSLTLIINRNPVYENKNRTQEYLQDTTKVTVKYEFIQNEEISCLEIF